MLAESRPGEAYEGEGYEGEAYYAERASHRSGDIEAAVCKGPFMRRKRARLPGAVRLQRLTRVAAELFTFAPVTSS
jgi:hypothetical protein